MSSAEPVYQVTPAYDYQNMPFLKTVDPRQPQFLKVSNTPIMPVRSTDFNKSPQVMAGVQLQRMPLIAAGYNTLTSNRCSNSDIDADYYTLDTAYYF